MNIKQKNQISRAIYGNTNNTARLSVTVKDAVNYATGYGHNYQVKLGALGYWNYARSIDNGKPILIGLQYKGSLRGHMVVARGYKWDTAADTYYLYVNDPSGAQQKYVNYAKFSSSIDPNYYNYRIFDNIASNGSY